LGAAGRVHVGFAPAAFFLCATAALREMGALLVLVCLVVGVMVGAFQLLRGLAKEMTWRTAAPLVATWSLVALIVGGRLSLDLLTFTLHGA